MAKKIGAIVSLSIIAVLIVATIVLANLKVDYSINCNNPDSIWVSGAPAEQNELNEIVSYIDNASNESRLTALFNGNWNKQAELVTENGTINFSEDKYYVRYHYSSQQQLKVGKETKDATYTELVFTISNYDEEAEHRVYVIPDASQSSNYSHYYVVKANFSTLYKYLENNFTK